MNLLHKTTAPGENNRKADKTSFYSSFLQKAVIRKSVLYNQLGMPPHITISVQFDAELQKLTGKAGHPVFVSEGANFMFLLMSVMEEYPEIQSKYPPGTLGFTINEVPPKTYTPLLDGDVVFFSVSPPTF